MITGQRILSSHENELMNDLNFEWWFLQNILIFCATDTVYEGVMTNIFSLFILKPIFSIRNTMKKISDFDRLVEQRI